MQPVISSVVKSLIGRGVSRNNLPKIKDGAYVKNLNDKKSIGTHWASLFIDKNTTYIKGKYFKSRVWI